MTAVQDGPAAVPSGEAAFADIAQTRESLRESARITLGVTGETSTEGFWSLLRRYDLSVYPIIALGLLLLADGFQTNALNIISPDVSASLGLSIAGIAGARALGFLAQAIAPFPMAALTQTRPRRAILCIVTGLGWSLITLSTGLVLSGLGLLMILVLDGLSTGSVTALHSPLLIDSYPPEVRVRAISAHTSFLYLGQLASPLLVALLAGPLNLTWRGIFIVLGLISTALTLFSLRLRDPGFGKWDTEKLRASVHTEHGESADDTLSASDVALGFWEICRRVLAIKTIQRVFVGAAVFGVMTIPYTTFLSFFLLQRWNLNTAHRGLFFAFTAAVSVIALVVYGARGEKQFRASPAKVVRFTGVLLAVGIAFVAVGAISPWFAGTVVSFAITAAAVGILVPALTIAMLSIVPATMRPHAGSLFAISIAIGAIVGDLLLGDIQNQYGVAVSICVIAVVGAGGALLIASAGKYIEDDLDRMIDAVLEDEEVQRLTAAGGHLPMLACRGIDFSYGQLQVLFDVDFTVDDGEMVALLGVNGAGKSTLLKVISGIGLPSRGSVRYRGQEITYLDAERRLRLGITQIPGGRAVFGPMTVVENLKSFGYTMCGGRRDVQRAIDNCFEAFPRLYERRTSLAATLSGGEQQMLGLSKALMLKPRLLVIDELSLGLAPVIVGQLLDMVRRINGEGTAVVLVEQSVNIALNLVEHAYFMEKGEMKFDGRAADLLGRDDLLRAVFLHGSAEAKVAKVEKAAKV